MQGIGRGLTDDSATISDLCSVQVFRSRKGQAQSTRVYAGCLDWCCGEIANPSFKVLTYEVEDGPVHPTITITGSKQVRTQSFGVERLKFHPQPGNKTIRDAL